MNKKRLNFLYLVIVCVSVMFMFLLTGCGNGCGQVPHFGDSEFDGTEYTYVSLPLCGGCLTSEWGCTSCL